MLKSFVMEKGGSYFKEVRLSCVVCFGLLLFKLNIYEMDVNDFMENMEIFEQSSSSSSSSSEDDVLDVISNVIIPEVLQDNTKNENFVEETVPQYSEKQFVQHFRLPRNTVEKLRVAFEESEYFPKKDTGFKRISSEKCILAFLWFASTEAISFRDIADRFNLSVSTLHTAVENVTMFLSNMSHQIIVWPSQAECIHISEEFSEMGFPNVIGCIDGTHIRIDAPSEDPESYLNRKKFYSIQMQVVCDQNRKIRDTLIGYPGSVHDARVFRNSPLGQTLAEKCQDFVLLGDSAYPCLRNLLTPYKDTGNLTNVHKNFNKKLSHCRVLIEHTIGLLKQRFRQLYHLKSRRITFICHFIQACCVLHNMCIEDGNEEQEYVENNLDVPNDALPEDEVNEVGLNYRNYVAAMLNI